MNQMGEKTCTLRKAERSVNLSAGGGSEGDRWCRRAWALVAARTSWRCRRAWAPIAVQASVGSGSGVGARGLRWHAWAPVARVAARTSRQARVGGARELGFEWGSRGGREGRNGIGQC
jgi:hypothetical protein